MHILAEVCVFPIGTDFFVEGKAFDNVVVVNEEDQALEGERAHMSVKSTGQVKMDKKCWQLGY
jgi:hypothetical protein